MHSDVHSDVSFKGSSFTTRAADLAPCVFAASKTHVNISLEVNHELDARGDALYYTYLHAVTGTSDGETLTRSMKMSMKMSMKPPCPVPYYDSRKVRLRRPGTMFVGAARSSLGPVPACTPGCRVIEHKHTRTEVRT